MDYIVITLDIKNSRDKRTEELKQIDNAISKINSNFKEILFKAISKSRGDEYQCVLKLDSIKSLFYLLREIKKNIQNELKVEYRMGIGIGNIYSEGIVSENTWDLNGEAFYYARNALEEAQEVRKKETNYDTIFKIENFDSSPYNINFPFDKEITQIYYSINLITKQWNEDTWQIISLLEKGKTQDEISKKLDQKRTNITNKIGRSHWYYVKDIERLLIEKIKRKYKK